MRRFKHITMSIGASLVLTMILATSTFASSFSTSLPSTGITGNVDAGTLTTTISDAHFTSHITIDGTAQIAHLVLPISVHDLSGTGAGWNLTITSTTLTTSVGSHKLDTSASTIASIGQTKLTGNDLSQVGSDLSAVPAADTAPTAVKLFSTDSASGMGTYTITPAIEIAIPAEAYAGTYSSTYTIAVVSGP